MQGLLEKRFRSIVRKLVQRELDEINVTGNLDGGLGPPKTPFWGATSGSEGTKAEVSGYMQHKDWEKHHG
jgi:hypothetical protein